MKIRMTYPLATLFIIAVVVYGCSALDTSLATVSYMDPADLLSVLDDPDVVVLDVRTGRDWTSAEYKIKGATRVAPQTLSQWADRFPKDKTLILY